MNGVPEADVNVSSELVQALLREQHPDLAALPVELVASGWDNCMFRLGRELCVRMPRRVLAADLIVHEQTWLPLLAARLPLPIPAPVRLGLPGCGYPLHWSIVPWLAGACLDVAPCADTEAPRFADFLRALHQPAPPDAPHNPVRGVPLSARAAIVGERLARLQTQISAAHAALWEAALAAPPSAANLWLHGDLHALNVLCEHGKISAVIDWGDVTGGDPASDLACTWLLFDEPSARRALLERYAPSEALLARARGWAVSFGAVLLETGLVNSPRHAALGAATLRRLADDVR